jgi:hypothetical protein
VKSFTIYEEYFDLITLLPTIEEQQELLFKITQYMFDNKNPKLNDSQMKIFKNLKRPLDKSKIKSKATSKQNQNEIKTKSKTNQKENTSNDVNVNVNGNVKNNKFIKPSIEEIKEYCNERKNGIDANAFYDFYESKGWKVGNQSMKNWKACIRTWEQRNKKQDNVPEWFETNIETTKGAEDLELKELIEKYE